MIMRIYGVLFCTGLVSLAGAELPFSLSIETKGGYGFADESSFGENEIVAEKDIEAIKGLSIGLENCAVYEEETIADEITLGVSYGVTDWLGLGVAPKLFIAEDATAVGIDGILVLCREFEGAGIAVEDENEFLYNVTDSVFEYVNTFCVEKGLMESENLSVSVALENELCVCEGECECGLVAGPVVGKGVFSAYINYAAGITSEDVAHGAELGCVLEF